MIQNIDDKELILKSQHGDADAFRQLMEKYESKIYNLCLGITGNEADAKDAFQDTFIHAFKKIKQFKFKSQFSTWLYSISHHLWIDKIRKQKPSWFESIDEITQTEEDDDLTKQFPDPNPTPDVEAEQSIIRQRVQEQLMYLDPDQRIAVILRYIEGRSYKEIAEITKSNVKTVGTRLYRAFKILEEKLLPLYKELYEP
jgi:RNA polymerase sigma-70 factor (ECF subfamily)